ncbi:hypothetical protein K466DRAFT_567301, partial [Polyporus arcularius HHB13444]
MYGKTSMSRIARVNADISLLEPVQHPATEKQSQEGAHQKRTLSDVFSTEEISLELPNQHRARTEPETGAPKLSTACSRLHMHYGPHIGLSCHRPQRSGARHSRILRTPAVEQSDSPVLYDSDPDVPIDDPNVLREKQKAVNATEKRSVRPLGYETDTNYWGDVDDVVYMFVLTLARKQSRSELDLWGGKVYKLAVDTADSSFWFYELEFKKLEQVQQRKGLRGFKKVMWPAVGPHKERKVLPAGDCSAVKEEAWHFYGDNGVVHVRRWEDCANDITASQVPDGNFGMGVPG